METAHTLAKTLRPLGDRQRSGRAARAGPSRLPGAARACDGDRAGRGGPQAATGRGENRPPAARRLLPPSPGQRTHHEKGGIL